MIVYFLEPAREEFREAVDYYQSQVQGLGTRFIDEVELVLELLESTPDVGSLYIEETRRVLLRHFPFAVVYLRESETVTIIAVAHLRRRPGYWKTR